MREHLKATSAQLVARITMACLPAVLVGSGCQSLPASVPTPTAAGFPIVFQERDGSSLTLDRQPHRIVSLSATATETLFAIGAGKQVVAVDDQSNYPPIAPITKLSEFQPNVEAIAGYSPELVVASEDTGGLVRGLAALKIPTLLEPAAKDLSDAYLQIRDLGSATGHPAEAAMLVSKMRGDIASIVSSVSTPRRRLTVYHELDDTFYSATSRTFIGHLYVLLGFWNIADSASGAAPDYPQLSAEFIVTSNPDLIVLADTKCCHQSFQTLRARPGWQSISAVKTGHVIAVDDDIASRWGPRVVDFLRVIAAHESEL